MSPRLIKVARGVLSNVPLGTLLGAYGLWVLMSSEGERYYRRVAIA